MGNKLALRGLDRTGNQRVDSPPSWGRRDRAPPSTQARRLLVPALGAHIRRWEPALQPGYVGRCHLGARCRARAVRAQRSRAACVPHVPAGSGVGRVARRSGGDSSTVVVEVIQHGGIRAWARGSAGRARYGRPTYGSYIIETRRASSMKSLSRRVGIALLSSL